MSDILVVGAGPVGLTMACELARHGARIRIVDQTPEPSPYCRAIGVTPRTLEVWEDMGVANEMIDAGLWLTGLRSVIHGRDAQDAQAPSLGLPYSQLGLPQYETERVLTRHLAQFGQAIERGVTFSHLEQDPDGVEVTLTDARGATELVRCRYVVGCDGAHSAVRRSLGIAFKGDAYPWAFMLGDVRVTWDLPYGMAFRALRLVKGGPPDMFVAIPLPEHGRYRISMLAPSGLVPAGGTDHGVQAELKGPSLGDLQAVADDLLPDKPLLSDLRWSSIFRISMRLAERYQSGRVFIAGDASHIHPPTGGQGMNTGIQDAYNLAWKLALVLNGSAREALLDSYDAERRPVGAEVVARTREASEAYGRERGGAPDRLADTQILVSYRGSPIVRDDVPGTEGPAAGDRAPDVLGLERRGLGFPLRLFDVLRGTTHVLLARASPSDIVDLAAFARQLEPRGNVPVRIVAVGSDHLREQPGVTVLHDRTGGFSDVYGEVAAAALVRPDGYIGWRGRSWREPGLLAHLAAFRYG